MKTKEIRGTKKFYKINPSGISLIVLVITIIVIIILTTAVILTLNKNNPIEEASKARYESDVANMQAIFTNVVTKVMVQKQSTIEINAGELNSIKVGGSATDGRVNYKLDNPQDDNKKEGTIIFNTGTNSDTTYYTGIMLPLYSTGETTWYIDSEGRISLKVGNQEYGNGDKIDIPAGEEEGEEIVDSDNPMLQSWDLYSATDFHAEEYRTKITKIKFATNVKVPNIKIKLWDVSEAKDKSVMAWIEDDGNSGYILTIAGKEKIIANTSSIYLFYNFIKLKEIENLNLLDTSNVTKMGGMFDECTNLISLDLSNFDTSNVTNMTNMFIGCSNLKELNLTNFDTSNVTSMQGMFVNCEKLEILNLSNFSFENVTDTMNMFSGCSNLSTTININGNKIAGSYMFRRAATIPNSKIIVNYTSENSTLVDELIATKSNNSNVIKGTLIN